jgi:putative heme iron utilization protein
LLKEILSDLLKIDDVLFVNKNLGAVSEIKSNSLSIRQKDNWISIGENDGPCHMHINSDFIKTAEFIIEQKPERTSFSIRFFDDKGDRILAGFFTKMYDENKNLKTNRKKLYDDLLEKYGQKVKL